MKSVRKEANELRGMLADCVWKKEEVEALDVQVSDLVGMVLDLPLGRTKGKFSLEHKLALAAAHEILPLCAEFERLLEEEGHELNGSTSALREANSVRSRLTAKLGAFVALSDGI